uniref:MsrB domain-containing protein n=1 Tax=Timspurckia oligopyrenoides TaxID=708627 RepID=A0A7S0ZD83_9RHOD|mmetsp:Transcript_13280/g.23854  ORF Transcript_13280/g.23854 Transcript_13280/m.23854 type:complete len:205 (+) Transcript_13280:149-763(+)|eukprot:CAMPEP_0182443870 /NCGR_PEP_ID=MMETSP1172-20130603/2485_1 /TAXON_ID=708627 /ORGANISM="Timspurckia oligopyrenoides, Strain CCMP3278" /LENGTH=204 /DNA_ID=CAMNT_0024639271 /DNA_START=151 /DNA_END=765 /DNA_ORIENTATION=+
MGFFGKKKEKEGGEMKKEPSKLVRALSRKKTDTGSKELSRNASSKSGAKMRHLSRKNSSTTGFGKAVTPNRVEKTRNEWKEALSKQEFNTLRRHMMEKPYEGKYVQYRPAPGVESIFFCKGCDSPVFSGRYICDPINGWLCFSLSIPGAVEPKLEEVGGMSRIEVICKGCDGFLGVDNNANLDINSCCVELRELGKEEYEMLLG